MSIPVYISSMAQISHKPFNKMKGNGRRTQRRRREEGGNHHYHLWVVLHFFPLLLDGAASSHPGVVLLGPLLL